MIIGFFGVPFLLSMYPNIYSRSQTILFWTTALFYWGFLTYLLLSSNPWDALGGETRLGPAPDPSDPVSSMSLHFCSYAILTFLLTRALLGYKKKTILLWLALAMFHGVLTELLQGLIPYRWTNLDDILSNETGAIFGYYFFMFLLKRIQSYPWARKYLIKVS